MFEQAGKLLVPWARTKIWNRNAASFEARPEVWSAGRARLAVDFHVAGLAPFSQNSKLEIWRGSSWARAALTLIFSVYAISLLAALLTVGALSDHVGRRPVILLTLASWAILLARAEAGRKRVRPG